MFQRGKPVYPPYNKDRESAKLIRDRRPSGCSTTSICPWGKVMPKSASGTRWRLPWSLLAVLGGLFILEILVFRGKEDRTAQPWTTVAAACIAVQAVFLLLRQLHGGLWGIL